MGGLKEESRMYRVWRDGGIGPGGTERRTWKVEVKEWRAVRKKVRRGEGEVIGWY